MKCCNILYGAPILQQPALSASTEVRDFQPFPESPSTPYLKLHRVRRSKSSSDGNRNKSKRAYLSDKKK